MEANADNEYIDEKGSGEDWSHCPYCDKSEEVDKEEPYKRMNSSRCYESVAEEDDDSEIIIYEDDSKTWPGGE